ncbi:hypothetical protein Tco_1528585 [Tanacetum coccineum]
MSLSLVSKAEVLQYMFCGLITVTYLAVDTLRVIGRTLGKQWDFKEDPCSVVTVVNKTNDADTVSDHKVSDDTVSCSREPNATICHVIAV